jgi:hypothetical protein
MKTIERRALLRCLAVSPVAATVLSSGASAQAPVPPGAAPAAAQAAPAASPVPAGLTAATSEAGGAMPLHGFFTAAQFATLKAMGGLLVPPLGGMPGAIEAQAPEFLDYYAGISLTAPVGRGEMKNTYRKGLDDIDARARRQFGKAFADLSQTQMDSILRPLLVATSGGTRSTVRPQSSFVSEAFEALRQATVNSPQWGDALRSQKQRVAAPVYWLKIDPTKPQKGA